ncbi:MAG: adenylate/guanylate cyclase domain-containing protein [Cyanobacteria bacterium P01_F01_bin.150]
MDSKKAVSEAVGKTKGLSIGVKIFGLATSLLGLLLLVAMVSTNRLRRVKDEIVVLAEYIIPITEQVALVDVHVLEQELHFERVQTLYAMTPINPDAVNAELALFEERGQLVDQELAITIDHIETALATVDQSSVLSRHTQQELEQILPRLHQIEVNHQGFHDHAVELLTLLQRGQFQQATLLESKLIEEAETFSQEVNELFLELEAFTVDAAQTGQQHQQEVLLFSMGTAAIATIFGLVYASIVSRRLVKPVNQLDQRVQQVRQGDLDTELTATTRDEIRTLTRTFNGMVQELRHKVQLEETFGKYMDPRIIQNVMSMPDDSATDGTRQVMTVFFSDVEGFDSFSQSLSADALVCITNEYLNLMSDPISDHSGVIDKFIDTVIMGFWGPPFTTDGDQAVLACKAALAQVARLSTLRTLVNHYYSTLPALSTSCSSSSSPNVSSGLTAAHSPESPTHIQRIYPSLDLHIGIATGPLVVGNMGSKTARSYTVMGDTVNIASRLKGASKQYGVQILMTGETQHQVAQQMITREVDRIQVVGKDEPVQIFELLGHMGALPQEKIAAYEHFHQGILAYRQQRWREAHGYFCKCLETIPGDRPSQIYCDRIAYFRNNPPAKDWEGVWQLTKK